MMHDATLEEMWRIKEELSAPNDSWEEYAAALYAFQDEERRNGVRFMSLPPCRTEPTTLTISAIGGHAPTAISR